MTDFDLICCRMKKQATIFLCVIAVLLYGCNANRQPEGDELAGLWNLSAQQETASDDKLAEAFLNLRTDKAYTLYLPDYFDYGRWNYSFADKTIHLTSARPHLVYNKNWTLQILKGNKKQLLVVFPGGSTLSNHHLDSIDERERINMIVPEKLMLTRDKIDFPENADPYSLKYNQWRIPARQKEACEELRMRIVNHLQHLQLLFEAYSKSSSETVSYVHSPTMFRMASNGIAMEAFDEIPDAFLHLFYDKEDAIMAYYLTEGFFRLDLMFPQKHEKYSELWAFLLKQMIDKGRKADLCGMVDRRVERYRADSAARAQQVK
jgi:hypothetical protein